MERIGRTHRPVEFKHQNISAVLEELGLPWIWGYKPKRNYQNALVSAIDRYLSQYGEDRFEGPPPRPAGFAEDDDVFVDRPRSVGVEDEQPPELRRLIRKFDPIEREARNRLLGKAGEEFVMTVERKRLIRSGHESLARKDQMGGARRWRRSRLRYPLVFTGRKRTSYRGQDDERLSADAVFPYKERESDSRGICSVMAAIPGSFICFAEARHFRSCSPT